MGETTELKEGQSVKVMRQIGAKGKPEEVTGKIMYFSDTVTIGKEKTAFVQYDDGKTDGYWHPVSKIKPV